jgi:hypothetical protein
MWSFTPLSEQEISEWIGALRPFIVPELVIFAHVEGKLAAAVQCIPDYHPILRRMNGRLSLRRMASLPFARRSLTRVRVISAHVFPAYQLMGLPLLMLVHILNTAPRGAMREAEFSWVFEDHLLSRRTIERVGARRSKTYRLYEG